MTDWPSISSGRKIRPSHITGIQDAVDGIQSGALPIALPGIAGALDTWSDGAPVRSASLRGKPTAPYWAPSEVVMCEDWGGGTTYQYDNGQHFASMVAQAKVAGGSQRGCPIRFGSGEYWTAEPLVLPRNGTTPTNVVPVLGNGIRNTRLIGLPEFPTNRGMIEWEQVEARIHHGRIADLNFVLPDVAGVKAIWHKRIATSNVFDSILTEWMQCDFENLLFEGDNTYHEVFIDLEVGNRLSRMVGLYGDPMQGPAPQYSTRLIRTGKLIGGDPPQHLQDGNGIAWCTCQHWYSMIRRGGFASAFSGRMYQSVLVGGFGQGAGWVDPQPTWDFYESFGVRIADVQNEGNAETAQFRIESCDNIQFENAGIGYPNTTESEWQASTAYVVGDRVIPVGMSIGIDTPINHIYICTDAGTSHSAEPTWPTGDGQTVTDGGVTWQESGPIVGVGVQIIDSQHIYWDGRLVKYNDAVWSRVGSVLVEVDADCWDVQFDRFNATSFPGDPIDGEFSIEAGADDVNISGYAMTSLDAKGAPYTITEP